MRIDCMLYSCTVRVNEDYADQNSSNSTDGRKKYTHAYVSIKKPKTKNPTCMYIFTYE